MVVDVTTWSNGNQIAYPGNNDASILLDNLSEFAPQITIEHDSVMLITCVPICVKVLSAVDGVCCDNEMDC